MEPSVAHQHVSHGCKEQDEIITYGKSDIADVNC